jgi:hypothetical protein
LAVAVDLLLAVGPLTAAVAVDQMEMVLEQHLLIAQVAVEHSPEVAQQLQQLHSAQLRKLLDVHNMVDLVQDILRQIMKAVVVEVADYSVEVAAIAMHLNPTVAVVVALGS